MRDALGPGTVLGYCTNVHAGATLAATEEMLRTHAAAVRNQLETPDPMGIGLWLPDSVANEIVEQDAVGSLRAILDDLGLFVFTMNGFPYGDFHQDIVKHDVYQPDWTTDERVVYTQRLMSILAGLLPNGLEGSISTVPLGWAGTRRTAAERLQEVAGTAAEIERDTGACIHVDLEPEPGCALQRAADVVRVFDRYIVPEERRYIRVCHDICHAAVMFESQVDVFRSYAESSIPVGKVQISSAPRARLSGCSPTECDERLAALREFSEPRYLHQTTIRNGSEYEFVEDLPRALEQHGTPDACGDEWRVHFHIPVDLEFIGPLDTTREDVIEALTLAQAAGVSHYEVETYAWDVLPAEHRVDSLSVGIARELSWVRRQVREYGVGRG